MMNGVWATLLIASVVAAALNGSMAAVAQASIDSAKAAVDLALGLIGVMTFWLGMMKIVQDGGLLRSLERGLAPVMTRLFPDVPAGHPAMHAMIMNIASNVLGLGNAATPFGLQAMASLETLNRTPGTATNAMVLFLAINTSNVSVAPLGVIALRAAAGSTNAAGIWLPTLLATSMSTAVAIIAAKLLQRPYAAPNSGDRRDEGLATAEPDAEVEIRHASTTARLLAVAAALSIAAAFGLELVRAVQVGAAAEFLRTATSTWTLPVLIATIAIYGVIKGVDLYDSAIHGAREGFQVATRVIPFLVAIMVAVGMFRASGLLDLLVHGLDPITSAVGFPAAALPIALLRPLSGSGAFALLAETLKTHGPDSFVGYLVSTLQGSTETTFYVLAVYFGSVGITRFRHAVIAGLLADLAGVIGATIAVRLFLVSP